MSSNKPCVQQMNAEATRNALSPRSRSLTARSMPVAKLADVTKKDGGHRVFVQHLQNPILSPKRGSQWCVRGVDVRASQDGALKTEILKRAAQSRAGEIGAPQIYARQPRVIDCCIG